MFQVDVKWFSHGLQGYMEALQAEGRKKMQVLEAKLAGASEKAKALRQAAVKEYTSRAVVAVQGLEVQRQVKAEVARSKESQGKLPLSLRSLCDSPCALPCSAAHMLACASSAAFSWTSMMIVPAGATRVSFLEPVASGVRGPGGSGL